VELGLSNRKAVVSPAGSPLAEACAKALRAEGARLVAPDQAEDADLVVAIVASNGRAADGGDLTTERLNAAWDDGVVQIAALFMRALPRMKAQRHGRLVIVAPLAAKHVVADAELDSIVSLGLLGMQKALSGEVGPFEVTANAVLWDELAALEGPGGTAETVAAAVAFLCSEPAAFLTGVALAVDGGRSPGMF
jgi:3-oxoacyl-[acyl-carrier protein] reductase